MNSRLLQMWVCALAMIASANALDGNRYLFVWAGDADKKASDFLGVIDVTPHQPNYGRIVASVPVEAVGTIPHHTEYSLSDSGFLFANGFESGKSFIFDVRDPLHPKVVRAFDEVEGYMHP